MLKKDKTKPFRIEAPTGPIDPESPTNPTGPTAEDTPKNCEDMLMNCAISKLKADRTPIPDNRFTLPPEYGVDGGGSSDAFNGHEYVDLGLPSGTLWAKMNVGAESETDAGLYFAWGETQGYTASQVGTDKQFSWNDYKYGSASPFTKYDQDGLTNLELTDDAAHVNWGGDWHMPNRAQCEELFNTDYVTNAWVTNYNGSGINGRLFTSVINGNTMFLPAAGYCVGGEVYVVGSGGSVWASALGSEFVESAWSFGFGSVGAGVDNGFRFSGESVRGVVGQMDEITDETTPGGEVVAPTK